MRGTRRPRESKGLLAVPFESLKIVRGGRPLRIQGSDCHDWVALETPESESRGKTPATWSLCGRVLGYFAVINKCGPVQPRRRFGRNKK